tara:strand:- start:56 stop:229 length:174 start_codon:yes stop_codon:yes gene_type:complete
MNDFLWMLKPITDRSWKIREQATLIDAKRAGVLNVLRTKRVVNDWNSKYKIYFSNLR